MGLFAIYNEVTKHVIEMPFVNAEQAETYRMKNFSSNYKIANNKDFDDNKFRNMLKPGMHHAFVMNSTGVSGIMVDGVFVHCGCITINQHTLLKLNEQPMKQVSKIEFVNLHNELIDSICN